MYRVNVFDAREEMRMKVFQALLFYWSTILYWVLWRTRIRHLRWT